MKPAITTEYVHTLNFFTQQYQMEHALGGLDQLIQHASKRAINFSTSSINQKIVHDSLKDIMPEALDEISYQRLEEIFSQGQIGSMDLRIILQWLVNKEVIPSGSYIIVFNF